MPYEPHHSVTPPPKGAKLWRYMDFTKLVSLLDKRSLFFSRADLLGDPFEGSFSRKTVEARQQGDFPQIAWDILSAIHRRHIRDTYVNCWHMSDHESAAMWKLYLASDGVAIQSSFERLVESLQESTQKIWIGKVTYVGLSK